MMITTEIPQVCGKSVDIFSYLIYNKQKADDILKQVIDKGFEGLILRNPVGTFSDTVIKRGAKGKAEKKVFSSTITYQNPKDGQKRKYLKLYQSN